MAGSTSGLGEISRRYALALFELADGKKQLDAVAADLNGLGGAIAGSEGLTRLIRSPMLSRDDQGRAMAAVLDKGGAQPLTRNFIAVVARNRRLFVLPEMIRAFQTELAERRGEVTAEVTTAAPLAAAQRKKLEDALKTAMGSKVSLEVREDASLIGGMVVRVGSRMVDGSLRSKLQRLKSAMKGAH